MQFGKLLIREKRSEENLLKLILGYRIYHSANLALL